MASLSLTSPKKGIGFFEGEGLAADEVELEIDACRMRGKIRVVEDPEVHRRLRKALARKYLPARLLSFVGVGQRTTFLVENLEELEAV